MDATRHRQAATAAGGVNTAPQQLPFERFLRRRAKPLRADLFIRVSEWVAAERRRLGLTQKAFALRHHIPVRQVKTYEAVALRWPKEAKILVSRAPDKFLVADLTRLFANRRWKSRDTLMHALERHANGKSPRKSSKTPRGSRDPNLLAIEERLRERLQTRVEVASDGHRGEMRISFFSPGELERLLILIDPDTP